MELNKQKELAASAQAWFDGKLKTIITENRRRYRMQLKDAKARTDRGLSAIPSAKSTSAVDRYVERLAVEMFQDPDSISFSSKSAFDPSKDIGGQLLTQDFIYRSKAKNGMFPFFTWHQASALAGAVDGLEAALMWWRYEAYTEPITKYRDISGKEIPKEVYDRYATINPDVFVVEEATETIVTTDTWWIDQLEPGKDILWDPTIGLLDVELGQFVALKLRRTPDQLKKMQEAGILTGITDDVISKHQKTPPSGLIYTLAGDKTIDDGQDVDLKDKNSVELGVFFYKDGCRWYVSFSLGDFTEEVSERKPVSEVWFGGRTVNILPVAVGYNKPKLFEQVGWAIPELIKPLEDEHVNHRNNVADAAKIAIQGRWWLEEGSDTNLDNLLNSRVVYGRSGQDFGPLETNLDIMTSLRSDDSINADINELIPAGLMSGARGVVPRGTNKTLGATQMGKMESDEKLGVQIMTRNETFLIKVLYCISQLTIAFETDATILRIAGRNAGIDFPSVTTLDGKQIPDLKAIDVDVDVQINAGLGAAPRYQKAQSTMQLIDWGKTHDIPVDALSAYRQLSVLAGYGPEDLLDKAGPPPPAPPPPPEYKATISIDLAELLRLQPSAGQFLMQKMLGGEMDITAQVKDNSEKEMQARMSEAKQNGGGMLLPDRTGQVVDATGPAAMGMSDGGMQS